MLSSIRAVAGVVSDPNAGGDGATVAATPGFAPPNPASRDDRARAARIEAATDRTLVERFNAGDESAFVEIVDRHRERIQALAGRFLRNHGDAEEVTQDTFIRAYRGLARFRGDASLATWLHRIAVNLARNRYWYFFRRRKHLTLSLDFPLGVEASGSFADLVASGEADPARRAVNAEFVTLVATCMKKLEAGQREILSLRTELNRSYEDIARALDINVGTVKSRIARARGQLRHLMTQACPEHAHEANAPDWFEPLRPNRHTLLNVAA